MMNTKFMPYSSSEVRRSLEDMARKAEKDLPVIRKDIGLIIRENIDDEGKINYILDTLLKYLPFGYGKREFDKLNGYYYSINDVNSESYTDMCKMIFKD